MAASGSHPRRCSSRRFNGLVVIAVLILCVIVVGGNDDPALLQARLRVGDLMNMRKALSGESAFPERYRSYDRDSSSAGSISDTSCTGKQCIECTVGEQVENLQAVAHLLNRELSLLRGLGCPCVIESIFPRLGGFDGGLPVEINVAGLLLDKVFALGPVECWWRTEKDLEIYSKVPAVFLGEGRVTCETPKQPGPIFLEVTLHGSGWALTSSEGGSNVFEMYDMGVFEMSAVMPRGSPTHGGVNLTITGVGFDLNRPMDCRAAGVRFESTVVSSTLAYCVTPPLQVGVTTLQLSQNGYTWTNQVIAFGVYVQPTIAVIFPQGGLGSEEIRLNLAGLGLTYQPKDEDLFCRWLTVEKNITFQALRIRNSSTFSCEVPKNTLGQHFLAGKVPVEFSILGQEDHLFTNSGPDGANFYDFSCKFTDILYGGLLDFWPQCTEEKCCPAGTYMRESLLDFCAHL